MSVPVESLRAKGAARVGVLTEGGGDRVGAVLVCLGGGLRCGIFEFVESLVSGRLLHRRGPMVARSPAGPESDADPEL